MEDDQSRQGKSHRGSGSLVPELQRELVLLPRGRAENKSDQSSDQNAEQLRGAGSRCRIVALHDESYRGWATTAG